MGRGLAPLVAVTSPHRRGHVAARSVRGTAEQMAAPFSAMGVVRRCLTRRRKKPPRFILTSNDRRAHS